MANVMKFPKPTSSTEKVTRTVLDTLLVTPKSLEEWHSPPFQRPVKHNEKVIELSNELKSNGGVWPGMVTLGNLNGKIYIIDGQHRKESFLISGLPEGYVDVRVHYFETMADMGEEFVKLNSQLVKLRPDDMLRGLEGSLPCLKKIRKDCPYVGYEQIRRGPNSPILSMSAMLRAWFGSGSNVPTSAPSGKSAAALARELTDDEAEVITGFLTLAYEAWGSDQAYSRLWSLLNLILCMWLYRHIVLTQYSQRSVKMSRADFKKCLMSLSANTDYLDWLVGRNMGDRDRSPAYAKIKATFVRRIFGDTGKKMVMPQPEWVHSI